MEETDYFVEKEKDGSVIRLIRVRYGEFVDPRQGVESLRNGEWKTIESGPFAHYVLYRDIGEEITEEEAREIAKQLGGSI